ncbi:MAG TPA: hypothetical protein VG844_14065 [Terracidiphilus sp.]|jgi:hypothetical protein|nr:hypothetical protein [Terracidiphilus sp.]
MKIEKPLILVFENDGKVQTHLYPEERSYKEYGIIIADLVRHVSNCFNVDERDVWEWVDRERENPTSPATEIKPN